MNPQSMANARVPSRAPFPWSEAMALGFGVLRLTSKAFWRMTPRELKLAADGAFGRVVSAPSRAALDALMQTYPDKKKECAP